MKLSTLIVNLSTVLFFDLIRDLTACPDECHCRTEEEVNCQRARLDYLPDDINSEVMVLDFSYNELTAIPPNITQFPYLRRLILRDNRVRSLGRNLLKNLNHLEHLDLSRNMFSRSADIDERSLANLTSLIDLDLSNNHLRLFPRARSASLERLNLENCSISVTNLDILRIWPKLKTLNLAHNGLHRVGAHFDSGTLSELNLTANQITDVNHFALSDLKSLTRLHLGRNYQLKSFMANSTSLVYLDLMDCNLDSLPGSWLPNLTTLELSKNHIRRLESGAQFELMPKIKVLNLGDNAMETVAQDSFARCLSLEILDLSRNPFRTLDERMFVKNQFLKVVNLSRTYIDSMIAFRSKSIGVLDLTDCEIRTVKWNSLETMPNLQFLYLSGNLLNEIPVNISSPSLIKLDLSNNRLSSLKNATFRFIPSLAHLNLASNRLVSLEFYHTFKGIRSFFVGDNPWRCECTNKAFEILYKSLSQLNSDVDDARCQTPEALEGKTWGEACGVEWFPWNFAQGDKAWMISVTLMAVFILSCCLFVSINRECNKRKKRQREAEQQARSEAQERLVAMIQAARAHREEESRNAPDPRESQGPPSYNEALTMPPLGSTASLHDKDVPSVNGSAMNINNNNVETGGKQRVRRKKRPKSPHRLHRMSTGSQESSQISDANQSSAMSQSNPDLLDKSGKPLSVKARRRRRRSQTRSQNMEDSSSAGESSLIETNM